MHGSVITVNDPRVLFFLLSNPVGDLQTGAFLVLRNGSGMRWGWPIVPQNEQG